MTLCVLESVPCFPHHVITASPVCDTKIDLWPATLVSWTYKDKHWTAPEPEMDMASHDRLFQDLLVHGLVQVAGIESWEELIMRRQWNRLGSAH